MKKVSVIVPVYNTERYLRKCLESLVNQTIDSIEIIVVNDGSKDDSQEIIDEFAGRFPEKILAFKKENGGLSDARNFGLEKASGEFIGFVDSDDLVEEEMFAEMYGLAKKHQAEMVICNLQKVNEAGKVTQKLTQIPNMPEKIELGKNFSVFSDLSYFACNKLFRRELFEERRFKKGVHFEDIQLVPQLLLECKVLAQTQNYHYQYFERLGSITKTHNARGLDILRAVEDVEEAFRRSGFRGRQAELKNFQILEGVYTYLAYLAFVKDEVLYRKMSARLKLFMKQRNIKVSEVLRYRRFGKNYLLSLPLRKQAYYLLYFLGQENLLRKIV
ncbi:Glycosyltransferase involved in cell wall bisynthesis [Cruoricaptor ignavus]|uniref:Glycosyltransferase involved in cell wall bisynthesis n=1 Tax=Cruoricaptor ignavus TaxID=1118202 RepID=A0A1M6CUU9_9FLAO|nr:glycosyltransferase family 2 protein [Cruoricaptor ignavus]SHI64564.1 Glycosyltransferase involved in cell wall bisynthesis [Cruoricaptor ignavus]